MSPKLLIIALLAALMPLLPLQPAQPPAAVPFGGWPARWQGRALKQLPLSGPEQRFAEGFPGRVAKFKAGPDVLILRWISRETRQLHPAADCFKGMGYSVEPLPPGRDAQGIWGRFEAVAQGRRLRVSERLLDGRGQSWSDVSAWYWDALLGRSQGPWWSETRVESVSEKLSI